MVFSRSIATRGSLTRLSPTNPELRSSGIEDFLPVGVVDYAVRFGDLSPNSRKLTSPRSR